MKHHTDKIFPKESPNYFGFLGNVFFLLPHVCVKICSLTAVSFSSVSSVLFSLPGLTFCKQLFVQKQITDRKVIFRICYLQIFQHLASTYVDFLCIFHTLVFCIYRHSQAYSNYCVCRFCILVLRV